MMRKHTYIPMTTCSISPAHSYVHMYACVYIHTYIHASHLKISVNYILIVNSKVDRQIPTTTSTNKLTTNIEKQNIFFPWNEQKTKKKKRKKRKQQNMKSCDFLLRQSANTHKHTHTHPLILLHSRKYQQQTRNDKLLQQNYKYQINNSSNNNESDNCCWRRETKKNLIVDRELQKSCS